MWPGSNHDQQGRIGRGDQATFVVAHHHVSVSCIAVFFERSYSSNLLLDMHGSDRFRLFLAELS